jgi:D-threo-aldose 1-dehydrogenase
VIGVQVGGPGWVRTLGGTGLDVTALCVGGGPLGSMPEAFGYAVSQDDAVDLVEAVLASAIRVLDTSNGYSGGESERRIGMGIAKAGGLPPDVLVVTKVDARDGDFSGRRVRESVRESSERLGLDTLPLVHLHDPEFHDWDDLTSPGGAVETLVRLREEGTIGHIGVAGGDTRVLSRYLDLGVFEAVLVHNRLTIVDRSAEQLVERAAGEGLGVINAAVYGGGILANPSGGSTQYGYRQVSPATLEAIGRMAELCARWGIDLPTAALQFSLRDPRVHFTVVGISKRRRLDGLLEAVGVELRQEFWDELETLVPEPENWLDAP